MKHFDPRQLMADAKFIESYAKWNEKENRYETWSEATNRVMNMHREKYLGQCKVESDNTNLEIIIDAIESMYANKQILGAQRSLQFGGGQIERNNMRMFNCVSGYISRNKAFQEFAWILLSGSGVGFSIQKHHIEKISEVQPRSNRSLVHIIEDSIEGWADAFGVILSSFFVDNQPFPKYAKSKVFFDYSKIRPKGSLVSGGYKAPGPEPLRQAINLIESLLTTITEEGNRKLKSIEIYDILMFIADCIVSGGVRRSATIAMFSSDDEDMIKAKTGNWYDTHPWRARSNNSVVAIRDEITKEDFIKIFNSIKQFGEPGFVFLDHTEITVNPCFAGETMVAVADGRNVVSIKQLAEENKKFPVYSAHVTNNRWVTDVQEATAFKTGTRETIRVHLSNGDSFVCTPEHELAIPGGKYINAKDSIGSELESINPINLSVVDITTESVQDVYDLNVPANSNFYILTSGDKEFKESEGVLVHNCVEIGMLPTHHKTGEHGWQGCNLCEINGEAPNTAEEFYDACFAASALGTLQAGYTHFPYFDDDTTKEIFEREALIGVSITGIMNNPKLMLDEDILKTGAELVVETNKTVAKMIGINPAARTTCVKPSGNAAIQLCTGSGIHAEKSKRYLRMVQMMMEEESAQEIARSNPYMVEPLDKKEDIAYSVAFPIENNDEAILLKDCQGVDFLEKVRLVQNSWVEYGTNNSVSVDPCIRHNVSNTVTVSHDQWDDVQEYVFEHKNDFAGISFISDFGSLDFYQAPLSEVKTAEEIITLYGEASMFASGLIVDATDGFKHLWDACGVSVYGDDNSIGNQEQLDRRAEWIRRFSKFADTYFNGDRVTASYCLKDVQLLYRWNKITKNINPIDFANIGPKDFVDVDTLGSQACVGNGCEIAF